MSPQRLSDGSRELLERGRYASTLKRVSFAGAALTSVVLPDLLILHDCSFTGADLRQATLDGGRFFMCDLRDADLRGASLRGVSFSGCDLRGADLRGVDLRYARFNRVMTGEGESGQNALTGAKFDRRALDLAQVAPDAIIYTEV